jgi:putative peptidoglycan lipid II flippase
MKLIKSTAIIGAFTMMSRILGLIRDVLMARFLGAGLVSDALFTAFKLPNLFRRVFAEGAFNAAFVPLYARRLEEEGEEAASGFASEALAALLVVTAILVAIFELTMPYAMNLLGAGLSRDALAAGQASAFDLAVLYGQITMPYLVFMSLAALFSGVLNTRHHFAAAAAAPIALNILLVGVLASANSMGWSKASLGVYLAIAMSLSGILQVALVVWACRKAGVKIGLKRPRMTPGVKRLFQLGLPGAAAAGITQINLMVSHNIATTQANAASWLNYADRLYQLPLGMIGIGMGIALLPSLSRALRAGDEAGASHSLNRALELSAFLTLPAAAALAAMPDFLIAGLFQSGAFSAADTAQTAKALRMFAFGLPAFVLIKVLTPAFFARENTRSPMLYAGASAIINVTLGATLFFTVGFYGLALATSVAAWANVVLLWRSLRRSGHLAPDVALTQRFPRIVLASVLMGIAVWFMAQHFSGAIGGRILADIGLLLAVSGAGMALYGALALGLKAVSLRDMTSAFKKG